MQTLMSIEEARKLGCEEWQLTKAAEAGKQILLIRWEDDYGLSIDDRMYGFTQWSSRPFTPRQGCDGTIDPPVHLLARHFCEHLSLDYAALYYQAYPDDGMWEPTTADRESPDCMVAEWPDPSDQSLRDLLYDLGDINNRSLLAVLQDKFEEKGFDVYEWWNR